jgi:hypothetical protein
VLALVLTMPGRVPGSRSAHDEGLHPALWRMSRIVPDLRCSAHGRVCFRGPGVRHLFRTMRNLRGGVWEIRRRNYRAPEFEGTNPMPNQPESADKRQVVELSTDFLGEDRHEFVAKLAYRLWEERGRPLGSPEVDWCAAERAVYSALVASGLVPSPSIDPGQIAEKIYR